MKNMKMKSSLLALAMILTAASAGMAMTHAKTGSFGGEVWNPDNNSDRSVTFPDNNSDRNVAFSSEVWNPDNNSDRSVTFPDNNSDRNVA